MEQVGWIQQRLFAPELEALPGPQGFGVKVGRMIYLVAREFRSDFCFERAASLTFATIISLFPLTVLFVTVAASVTEGKAIIDFIKEHLTPILAPDFQKPLNAWLEDSYTQKGFKQWPTGLINLIAAVGLLLSALGVLVVAERVFNRIWKVRGRRSYFQKVTTFWLLLTTSPFLILASIGFEKSLSPLQSLVAGPESTIGAIYSWFVAVCVGFLAFTLTYKFLPSARVKLGSAAVGAVVAAVFWELSKRGFYLYVELRGQSPNFYTHVAAIPLFLIWIYLTWVVALCGGEISYVYQNLKILSRETQRRQAAPQYSLPYLGVFLTARVAAAFQDGRPSPTVDQLAEEIDLQGEGLQVAASFLVEKGILVEDSRASGAYLMGKDPRLVLMSDLVNMLGCEAFPGDVVSESEGPPEGVGIREDEVARRIDGLFRRARKGSLLSMGELTLESFTTVEGREKAFETVHEDGKVTPKTVDSRR